MGDQPLPQRMNAVNPWATATPTPSTASTVSATTASPMYSNASTSSRLSTATASVPTAAAGSGAATEDFGARLMALQRQVEQRRQQQGQARRRKTRGRKTMRGGYPVPPGVVCTFPTQAEKDAGVETREFEDGEVVCVGTPTSPVQMSGTYLRSDTTGASVRHFVKIHDQYPDGHSLPWYNLGKYSRPASSNSGAFDVAAFNAGFDSVLGTGAAGQGMGTGTQSGPLLAASPAGQGRRKTKKRVTRRR